MVLWLGEIFSIIKSVILIGIAIGATILVARVLAVPIENGGLFSSEAWTGDEMKDWSNAEYWRDAVVWTLIGWAIFIGGVVAIVCLANSSGTLLRCLFSICCSIERRPATVTQYAPPPAVQLVLSPGLSSARTVPIPEEESDF